MDPLRFTEEGSEATEFERELLAAGQRVGMSAEQKQQAWAGILLQIPPTPSAAPPAAGIPAQAAAGGGLFGLKAFLTKTVGIAALVATAGGGYLLLSAEEAGQKPAQHERNDLSLADEDFVPTVGVPKGDPSTMTKPSGGNADGARVELPSEMGNRAHPEEGDARSSASHRRASAAKTLTRPTLQDAPADTKPEPDSEEEKRASQLREESMAVLEIRRTLRGGDPAGALRLLEAARSNFPGGVLGQEREALTIEALARSGNSGAASRRATAFLERFPKSPYASDVRAFAQH